MEVLVKKIGNQLLSQSALLATAESCTGGWVAKLITDIPGSSQWFDRGFVTYSNAAKIDMLGVREQLISEWGAVSIQVAKAMAEGVLNSSCATYSISVTGIAGPGGGSEEKPVGTVCFAWSKKEQKTIMEKKIFTGDREKIRFQSASYALQRLDELFF